jgi:hypothetical protein
VEEGEELLQEALEALVAVLEGEEEEEDPTLEEGGANSHVEPCQVVAASKTREGEGEEYQGKHVLGEEAWEASDQVEEALVALDESQAVLEAEVASPQVEGRVGEA